MNPIDNEHSDLLAFYQVSDNVLPKVITNEIAPSCDREDCRFSVRKNGSTMMGTASAYDKKGQKIIEFDPNYFNAKVCCGKCWKAWAVDQDGKILRTIKAVG